QSPAIQILADEDGRVRRMTPVALEFLGTTAEDAAGRPAGEVLGVERSGRGAGHAGAGAEPGECPVQRAVAETAGGGPPRTCMEVRASVSRGSERRNLVLSISTSRVRVGGRPMVLLHVEDATRLRAA